MSAIEKRNEIGQAAIEVRDHFLEALLILPGLNADVRRLFVRADLESNFEQFRVWSRNTGAFAADEASLDYRLRDHSPLIPIVLRTLGSISEDLAFCVELATENVTDPGDKSILEEDGNSNDSAVESGSLNHETASFEDDEDNTNLGEEIVAVIDGIAQSLTRLISLAIRVRKSGRSSRAIRAAGFDYEEDGIQQIKAFKENYLAHILRKVSKPVQSRMLDAISNRRRVFEYQRRHGKKLAYGFEDANVIGSQGRSQETCPDTGSSEAPLLARLPPPLPNIKPAPMGSKVAQSIMSGTVASGVTSHVYRNPPRSSIAPSHVPSTTIHSLDRIGKPPAMEKGATHFECPFCAVQLPREKREIAAWRSHVFRDLRPFVCVSKVCSAPHDCEFEDEAAWLDHQRSHVLEWLCDGDGNMHDPIVCATEEEFDAHLKTHERTLLTTEQRQTAMKYACRPSALVFSTCPFCKSLPPLDESGHQNAGEPGDDNRALMESSSFQLKMKNHLVAHFRDYFQYALLPSVENDVAADSDQRTMGAARSTIAQLNEAHLLDDDRNTNLHVSNMDLMIPDCDENCLGTTYSTYWTGYEPGEIVDHGADRFLRDFVTAQSQGATAREGSSQSLKSEESTDSDAGSESDRHEEDHRLSSYLIDRLASRSKEYSDSYFLQGIGLRLAYIERLRNTRDAIPAAAEGTCAWFLSSAKYLQWISAMHPDRFVLKGEHGWGKSVLCKHVSQHLRDTRPNAVVLEYYEDCMQSPASISSILESLVYQIIASPLLTEEKLDQAFPSLPRLDFTPTEDYWLRLFTRLASLTDIMEIYIVLDGLDSRFDGPNDPHDTHSWRTFEKVFKLSQFAEETEIADQQFKIFQSSETVDSSSVSERHLVTLGTMCSGSQKDLATVTRAQVASCINALSSDYLSSGEILEATRQSVQQIIQAKAMRTAAFLWVRVLTKAFDNHGTFEQLDEFASSFPEIMVQAYGHYLVNLESEDTEYTRMILSIVIHAYEDLSPNAVAQAIAVSQFTTPDWSLTEMIRNLPSMDKVVKLCSPFCAFVNGKLKIAHKSAKNFLLNSNLSGPMIEESAMLLPRACVIWSAVPDYSDLSRLEFAAYVYTNGFEHYSQAAKMRSTEGFWRFFVVMLLSTPDNFFFEHARYFSRHYFAPAKDDPRVGLLWTLLLLDLPPEVMILAQEILPEQTATAVRIERSIVNARDRCMQTPLMLDSQLRDDGYAVILMELGADVHAHARSGFTALHFASREGHISTAHRLLLAGASVVMKTRKGWTPLMLAKSPVMFNLLMEHGSQLTTRDVAKMNALDHAACEGNNELIVEILRLIGTDGQASEVMRATLHHAAHAAQFDTVELLLEHNAPQEPDERTGSTPLHETCNNSHVESVQLLVDCGACVDAVNFRGETPLHCAARSMSKLCCQVLLKAFADANICTEDGETPLIIAAENGEMSIVKLLIDTGADPKLCTAIRGTTALARACQFGNLKIAEYLLEKIGPSALARQHPMGSRSAQPPLCGAAENGHIQIVEVLLKHGAYLDVKDDQKGYTPLFLALDKNHINIVRRLVDHGASIKCDDGGGKTALHCLAKYGQHDYMLEFINRGAEVNAKTEYRMEAPLHYAARNGSLKTVVVLVNCGADITSRDKKGYTPLVWGCRMGHIPVVRFLLERHDDPNTLSPSGSCLMFAAMYGDLEICELLVKARADPNLVSSYHAVTPLHAASEAKAMDTVRYLLSCGADVAAKSRFGVTPLHVSVEAWANEVVELLVSRGSPLEDANFAGETPLCIAVRLRSRVTVDCLIHAGANIYHLREDGQNVLDLARHFPQLANDLSLRRPELVAHEDSEIRDFTLQALRGVLERLSKVSKDDPYLCLELRRKAFVYLMGLQNFYMADLVMYLALYDPADYLPFEPRQLCQSCCTETRFSEENPWKPEENQWKPYICKTCISIVLCKGCFEKFYNSRPDKGFEWMCSNREFLDFPETQAMLQSDESGIERDDHEFATVERSWLENACSKYCAEE
ncbi:MAG: hypothetical protein M1828_001822 [Chrysothrix sp. TS-e1954]|nr:MAG: hypothetical protein M1828_001822 [Chrysothrix sp. TS-e1954]